MNCPTDGTTLQMTDRQGIEIDYCPRCRGVWLDRGELDKIIERSASWDTGRDDRGERGRRDARHDRYDRYDRRPPKKKKKASSFLESIMEFGE